METNPAFRGIRALIVEDETLLAEEIRERLTRLGFTVVDVVDNGEQAIHVASTELPDLILMDIRLKGKTNGIDAAERIRERNPLPVVFLTAHSDVETRRQALLTQPFGYIVKPFQERDLVIAIELALKRYELERRLSESEHRYVATLDSIGDGVIATDPNGIVTFMNRVATTLTQWQQEDARGRPVGEVLPVFNEITGVPRESPALEALRRRETVHLEEPVLLVPRDTKALPIDDSAAPIVTEQGKLLGSVIAFRDVRQRRASETALKTTQEQLRQAQKMEAIGRLAGGIAHDFNNFLTVIVGTTDLVLTSGQLDSSTRSLLEEVRIAGERASDLTRQLLAFGRKQVLRPSPVHIDQLLHNTLRMLERLVGENISIEATVGIGLRSILADAGQLEQVIFNLVINARDAMPTGGRLTIDVRNVDRLPFASDNPDPDLQGAGVLLSVTDTGTGMSPEVLERAFEPFFTTKEPGQGTGLGLATVYGIVKQSGGAIQLLSAPGKGTTVQIFFPGHFSTERAATNRVEPRPLQGSESILLVEDDDGVRALISTALRYHGYTVHVARNGDEAIQMYQRLVGKIELLVTDVIMPGMNGRQLAEHISKIDPKVSTLFVSGYTDDEVVRQGIGKGKVQFLQKPFTPGELAKKVRQVLDLAIRPPT